MTADAYTRTDPPPEAELVLPRAGRLIGWLALGAVLVLAALVALPDRAYLRFQALSDTIHSGAGRFFKYEDFRRASSKRSELASLSSRWVSSDLQSPAQIGLL